MGLTHDIGAIKQQYRDLFELAHQRLLTVFTQLHSKYHCSQCNTPPDAIDHVLHPGCEFRNWQKESIITMEQTIGKQILESLDKIQSLKEVHGSCHSCGVCCSLSSSQFSPDELGTKANEGDPFAQQFLSVFLPYDSHDHAKARHPELVEEIVEQADGPVYFYHCPHLTDDNKCSIYNDPRRPDICKTYPDTPLVLMYKKCGYQPWKAEMLPTTLLAQATLELCQYYSNRILEAVKSSGLSER